MTARVAATLLDWYAVHRRRALARAARSAAAVQERTLLRMVHAARRTELGLSHGFASIRSVAEYQARVPLRSYLEFAPLWARAGRGEPDVTWPGTVRYWVKTAGTTAGEKVIPVTAAALRTHRRGGWDALTLAAERVGAAPLLGGSLLFPGGSTTLSRHGADGWLGDLSGLVVRDLPPVLARRYSPGPAVAGLGDWETRLTATAAAASRQDVRMVAGMPSWTLILLERVAYQRGARPGQVGAVWPGLRVFVHGGVAFAPYRPLFEEWLGRPLEYLEVYPASEGFVALQTEPSGGLTLMVDYGLFYEFVPVEDLGRDRPRRHTVADVELDRPYAIALTTPAGLWSYLLGDTVRFVARDPLRLAITGRIRHFVNAFGENVIVEEVERALVEACRRTEAEVVEFTVAPRYPAAGEPRGGHDWLVEFRRPPRDAGAFARALDAALVELNADYRSKRHGDVGMLPPRLVILTPGSFHRWMRAAGKLGDQHKVPRVTNDRAVAEALLAGAVPAVAETLPARHSSAMRAG
jgi:hypothetical protein